MMQEIKILKPIDLLRFYCFGRCQRYRMVVGSTMYKNPYPMCVIVPRGHGTPQRTGRVHTRASQRDL